MKTSKLWLALFGIASLAIVGCGSNDSDTDAGTGDAGVTLYPMSDGTYCYKITGVSAVTDGCTLGVASLVGSDLPGTYVSSTAAFTLGTSGSLGGGYISYNTATLSRTNTPSDTSNPSCTWSQTDTTLLTLTAQNAFTASVTETESGFATACGTTIPTGGSCTSTWTWTFAIDSTKTAPACQ